MRLPVPLDSNYGSTRLATSEQRTINMYPAARRGFRQFPGLASFYSDTEGSATFTQNQGISAEGIRDIRFNGAGTKAFFLDQTNDQIEEATLSAGWDISSIGSTTATALTHPTPVPTGFNFNADGTKMYVCDADRKIYQYTLSPAYDTTSLSYDSVSLDMSSEIPAGGFPYTFTFNSDGTKLYAPARLGGLVSTTVQSVLQYSLSSAYDLSSATYDNTYLDLGFITNMTPVGIDISADDTTLIINTASSEPQREYRIVDSSDIATAQIVSTLDSHTSYNVPMWTFNGSSSVAYTAFSSNYYFTDDDFTIVAWVAPDDSTPAAFNTILSMWQTGSTKDWYFGIDTSGDLQFSSSTDGSTTTHTSTSSATPSWPASGGGLWVRMTWSGSNVLFYTSTDARKTAVGSVSWSQLGATQAHGSSSFGRQGSSRLEAGSLLAGSSSFFDGQMCAVSLIGGTDATVTPTAQCDPRDHAGPCSINWITFAFTSATGEAWTTTAFILYPDVGISFGDSGGKLYINNFDSDTSTDVDQYALATTYSLGQDSKVARGMLPMDGILYAIWDTTLYSISSLGAATSIGTIDGTERVVMETDGVQLVITTGTTGNKIYVYTVAGGLVTVTDADIEDNAKSSAYTDLAFYFDQADGKLIASDNNDATAFSTDDILEAESFADDIVRMYAHNQLLYAFGESSTEVYYTSGVGRPPIDRQQVIERGIIGTHAIDSIDDTIFFVDQFRRPNMLSGLQYQPIYQPGVAEAWESYNAVSDCIVTAYSYRQQTFVDFIFPSADKHWTYHVDSQHWSERQASDGTRYKAVEYANIYNKTLALWNSNIWELEEGTYQDNSANMPRTKDTVPITAELFDGSVAGDEVICNGLKITTDCTTDSTTITVTLSKDGAAFGQSRTLTVNSGLETRELNRWGRFREGVFRFSTTANAGVDIVDVQGEFEVLNG